MTEPSERAREIAKELLSGTHFSNPADYMHLRDEIAAAIDAAYRVPEGHIREGVTDRKVLGTLAVTKDGCVVGHGVVVYEPGDEDDDPIEVEDLAYAEMLAAEVQADADRELGRLVRKLHDENNVGVYLRRSTISIPRMDGQAWQADTLDDAVRAAWEGLK